MTGRMLCVGAGALFVITSSFVQARDNGQWTTSDPATRIWYESLRQPDQPRVSCCGDSDAYFADEYDTRDGRVFARITDNRGHAIPIGTVIEVPPHKVNRDPNPTGHIVIFLGGPMVEPIVYCYVPGSGA